MKKKSKNLYFTGMIAVILVSVYAISEFQIPKNSSPSRIHSSDFPESIPPVSLKPSTPELKITLAAAGDILAHRSIYTDACKGDFYNFKPMFLPIKQYLEKADLAFANQESVTGGAALGLSDYPRFNSPLELADAVKDAGIDVVSMANNHAMDRGETAILRALQHHDEIGMKYVGVHKERTSSPASAIFERNGIRVAFLAYTYGLNGMSLPKDKPFMVDLINKTKVKEDVARTKRLADAVVVSFHMGTEYQKMPNNAQKELFKWAAENGADLILGHHPHVLQPLEWITTSDGRRCLAVYSLGNFLAAQKLEQTNLYTGGILFVDFVKSAKGRFPAIRLQSPRFLPTYISHHKWRQYSIVPLDTVSKSELPQIDALYQELKLHMTQWIPELRFLPS